MSHSHYQTRIEANINNKVNMQILCRCSGNKWERKSGLKVVFFLAEVSDQIYIMGTTDPRPSPVGRAALTLSVIKAAATKQRTESCLKLLRRAKRALKEIQLCSLPAKATPGGTA